MAGNRRAHVVGVLLMVTLGACKGTGGGESNDSESWEGEMHVGGWLRSVELAL